ncbi:alpha-glucan family phosphorylase [Roseovarius pacificus]|uniref:alpha-glucan family phosphorylase n=1 Tax=Roseovarius pacificus TaxID=337701 RepID=UPI002A189B6A|nr:alpha-glucan family phosphorylase [Roseovarius pacificus]
MKTIDRLRELARNLHWTWDPYVVEIFRDIDPQLWRRVGHNPVGFLEQISEETIAQRSEEIMLEMRITHAFHGLRAYLESEQTWGAWHAGPLRAQPVAYFSAEFGIHESLPIYSGGLGVLSGDHLKTASDLGIPMVGVGLFYAEGYFNQSLDAEGWQKEHYLTTNVDLLPMERATDAQCKPIEVTVAASGAEIHAGVWTARVGRNRLVLLDTNVKSNTKEDRSLTAQLYSGDRTTRIRQELVLGVGGMRALTALGISPGVIHLNEGHSAFGVLEFARTLMDRNGLSFLDVQEKVAAKTVFTTHTPVPAGHDRFDPKLVLETLAPLRKELGIDDGHFMSLGRVNTNDIHEPFCMTVLGIKMSRYRNAVSALHGEVSRNMWRGLWPDRQVHEVPIGHITNGIHVPTWLAHPMDRLYARYLGEDWHARMAEPETWSEVDDIDDSEFWEQHQAVKLRLIQFARRRWAQQMEAKSLPEPSKKAGRTVLDPEALTIGFARRFATYKRGDLLLRDLDRFDKLVNAKDRPVQFVFAGKAHPHDEFGKQFIQKVFAATQDPRFAGRVVFIEDYNMDVGRHLVQGVDVWLNNPRRPLEACGTSGQKVILNGGLNCSVLDGWWVEGYDGNNGFAIGCGDEHANTETQDAIDLEALYAVLENGVVPLYYDRDTEGVPRKWLAKVKHSIRTMAWRFSAARMMTDYAFGCYLPAAGGMTSSFPAVTLRG